MTANMNVIFYKEFLFYDDFTPNEKIVYSFLVFKSLTWIDCAFSADGDELDMETIKDTISENSYIAMYQISYRKLAQVLNMSPRSVMDALGKLKSFGIIDCKEISIPLDVIENGYFNLYIESGLKGELLIFYSYLKNKCKYFGGSIDTMKYKLAENLHTTKIAVTNLLNRLYKKGLAERLPNGRLQIN